MDVRPSELWFEFCNRNGLDPYDRLVPQYAYFKKIFNEITPHYKDSPALDVEECWMWRGRFNAQGYPFIGVKLANREAYVLFKGVIARNKKLFRTCGHRPCVNPNHAQQTTQAGVLELSPKAPSNRQQCPAGHLYTEENTYRDRSGRRRCRICGRSHASKWRLKIKKQRKKLKREENARRRNAPKPV